MTQVDPNEFPVGKSTASGRFVKVPEALVVSGVSDAAIRFYAVLALHADRRSGTTFVGYRAVAALLGKSRRSLMRACAELVDVGAVEVVPRTVGGRRTSNLYRLTAVSPVDRFFADVGDRDVTDGLATDVMDVRDTGVTTVSRIKGSRIKGSKPNADAFGVAKRIASAVYTHDRLINFMAVLKLAERALKAGQPAQRIERALLDVVAAGRPITGETLRVEIGRLQKLPKHRRRSAPGADNPWEVR